MRISTITSAVVLATTVSVLSGCANMGHKSASDSAAGFPDGKPIEIIVPYDAGGATDVLTRRVAQGMSKQIGSPVQVVNMPGAGGSVGLSKLAATKGDGLTVGAFNMPSGLSYIDPSRSLTYNRDSFAPVAGLAVSPTVVAVRADAPWRSFGDLVDAAHADPGHIILAGGTNSTSDDSLTVSALEKAGIDFNVVSIDTGGADKTTQLLGGQLQVTVGSLGTIQTAVQNDQVRLLAVASSKRSELLPDVPTLTELGYDIDTSGSVNLAVPADTPQEAIQVLTAAVQKALQDQEVAQAATAAGFGIQFMNAGQLGTYWQEQEAAAKKILGID